MTDTVIRQVAPTICIFSRPFYRFGPIPVGGRSTAIKLSTGDVCVLASTKLDDPTKAKLHQLGPVKYIMAADAVHTMFISDFKREFPDAKCIGVEPLPEKRKDINWDGAYGRDAPDTKYGFEPEIQAHYIPSHVNQDVAFLHTPSKTLIEADLLFNLPAKEQTKSARSWAMRWSGFGPESGLHKRFSLLIGKDQTIIPCHGDVIEADGKKAWTNAYEWLLKSD